MLVKFGLCPLVVIDDGTPFKGAFVAMCTALDLNYDILAKRNHEGLSVEHFHRFLNKVVTIAMEDRQSNDVFVPSEIAVDMREIAHLLLALTYYAVLLQLAVNLSFLLI